MKSNLGPIVKESGLRRDVIQNHLGISKNTLSNWTTGKTTPTVRDLFRLAHFLNRKVDEFYELEEHEK